MSMTEKPDTGIIRWGILNNKKSSQEPEMIFVYRLFIEQTIFQHIKESGSIFVEFDVLFTLADTA